MLSKSAAKAFFLIGTGVCVGAFVLLTVDTIRQVPKQTHEENLTESAIRGKELWSANNCMGCHTLMGEGGYYAPELTKVFERRGASFIHAMIKNPQAMYPGQRKMQQYHFTDAQIDDLVAFLKWVGEIDLNGFPAKPNLMAMAVPTTSPVTADAIAKRGDRPQVFNQVCVACHSLDGQGGKVGPALDGVGSRFDRDYIAKWLADPSKIKPGTLMPKLPLKDSEIVELSAFLSQLKKSE